MPSGTMFRIIKNLPHSIYFVAVMGKLLREPKRWKRGKLAKEDSVRIRALQFITLLSVSGRLERTHLFELFVDDVVLSFFTTNILCRC